MNFSVFNLTMVSAGAVLLWCAVTDRNPVDVVKAILTGQPVPERGSWGTAYSAGKGLADIIPEIIPGSTGNA